jgi:hypothetical protein
MSFLECRGFTHKNHPFRFGSSWIPQNKPWISHHKPILLPIFGIWGDPEKRRRAAPLEMGKGIGSTCRKNP